MNNAGQEDEETEHLIEEEDPIDTESIADVQVDNGNSENPRNEAEGISWKSAVPQIVACCIVHTIVIQAGINMAFSAVLLPQLNETESDIHVTKSEGSWIASLVTIVLPLGSLIIGPLIDTFGRRKMCMVATLPFIISWLVFANAKSVWYMYCARVLAGFGGGLSTVGLVYVSEISHPSFRPMLLGLNSVFVSFGILLTCLFGYWLHWRTISYINCGIIVLSLLLLFVIPESPHWLIAFKDDMQETSKSLQWLYKDHVVYVNQYQDVISSKPQPTSTPDSIQRSRIQQFKEHINEYTKPRIYKPFLILCVIFLFQQLSGAYVIIFYAVQLFSKIENKSETGVDPNVSFVVLGIIRFVMAVISSVVSKRFGRRPLLIVSGLGMSITILVAGATALESSGTLLAFSKSDIALYFILGYVCFSSLAYLVIPWTLIGELLPVKVRGILGGFIVALAYVLMFGTVKVFPFVLDAIRLCYIFYALCVINFCGVSYIYYFLPETLGRSFDEIETYFR